MESTSVVVQSTDGIQCPSDAPRVTVGTFGLRADIEWTTGGDVPYRALVAINKRGSTLVETHTVAIGNRLEWVGEAGTYEVRVRMLPCDDHEGLWSEPVIFSLYGAPTSPIPMPPLPSNVVCVRTVIQASSPDVIIPIAVPDGAHELIVETRDNNHRPGYQPEQTHEQVMLLGNDILIGTTDDIPEGISYALSVFQVNGPVPYLVAKHVGGNNPNSVHGVCVEVR